MKELQATMYDSRTYSDENMLMNFKLIDPVRLSMNLTHLWGRDSDRFPLLSLTEGQGNIVSQKPKTLNDTQYIWDVMGRMKHTSPVKGLVVNTLAKPGLNYQEFEVFFRDNWIIKDYGVYSPDGSWHGRVQGEGEMQGDGTYKYRLVGTSPDKNSFCDPVNFEDGKFWVMSAPMVAASKSDGNRSNSMAPGKMTNQFGFHRFSKNIAGNIANKVTPIQFQLEDENGTSGSTNLWMPFELKMFELDRRFYLEEDLWYSEYNRDEFGVIHLKDPRTNEPIPRGAGVRQAIKESGYYDTISELTLKKVDTILDSIYGNRVDDTPAEIVVYTGKGGTRMWNNMIMSDAFAKNFTQTLGDNIISGGEYLTYGRYFNQYRHIDGGVITVKQANIFDHGLKAEQQRKNGDTFNGLPLNSYTYAFVDQSRTVDGGRNLQMVAEEGREIITGVYKGMSPLPPEWGSFNDILSTRDDVASYEVMTSQGINFLNPTTSFWLEMVL
jgi:hypothetical protein